MKLKQSILFTLTLTFLTVTSSFVLAQEQEEEGHVFTISTWKVKFGQVNKYLDLLKEFRHPEVEQNEFLISRKVFRHHWGPDWNIVIIQEFEDLASIDKYQKRNQELRKKMHPDKTERDKIAKQLQELRLAHTDAIVTEVPKLRK
ncbi:hypothetical protein IH879_16645 [candidate division KSB1 bacterium]|nr:hypothetical protein [candidate division KSB1 bacterium]